MVNGSVSPKIVDIYYEKDLTFIEFWDNMKQPAAILVLLAVA